MADIDLSQAEADALIAMEKVRVNDDAHTSQLAAQLLCLCSRQTNGSNSCLISAAGGSTCLEASIRTVRGR